jgi:FlaA1/EpsC-like NDP-sugar epimerase
MKKIATSLYKNNESLSSIQKRWLLFVIDILLLHLSIAMAQCLGYRSVGIGLANFVQGYWPNIFFFIVLKSALFYILGIYRPILRFTGIEFISNISRVTIYAGIIQAFISLGSKNWPLPKSVLIIDILSTLFLAIAVRLAISSFLSSGNLNRRNPHPGRLQERLLIYGAGISGSQLVEALKQEPGYQIVAFIDDSQILQNRTIRNYKIHAAAKIPEIIAKKKINTLILAMPSIDKPRRRAIIEQLEKLPIAIKTVPSYNEILSNKVSINEIRRVDVADLLGREEVLPEPALLSRNVTGKTVLVTGAGGSIGSELCRQIANLEPACLILYELNEFALYSIDMELSKTYAQVDRRAYLGNVSDYQHLTQILKSHAVQTVYHAAAYKHVPLVEANPAQGIFNNVQGTMLSAQAAIAAQVKNFVLISTDKAVRPTNVMGASKRTAELVIQALADRPNCPTCFGIVRFGNVLDSSGSVVPHFRKQIAEGKPITVTHPEVTRYFMSIPEAVRLVMQAGAMAIGGEVFVLEMGEPVRIFDLAEQMIRLSGLIPGQDIEINITGLRPGEKLFEELLIDGDNIRPTKHPKIFCAFEHKFTWEQLQPVLQELFALAQRQDTARLIQQLQKLVPEYKPDPKLLVVKELPISVPLTPVQSPPTNHPDHEISDGEIHQPLSSSVELIN